MNKGLVRQQIEGPYVPGLQGQEVTVIIRTADGAEYETTGTFRDATWSTDYEEVPSYSDPLETDYYVRAVDFHLYLRATKRPYGSVRLPE